MKTAAAVFHTSSIELNDVWKSNWSNWELLQVYQTPEAALGGDQI